MLFTTDPVLAKHNDPQAGLEQVVGEKSPRQVSETAERAEMQHEGGYVDLNLKREGGRRMVFA